MTGPLRSRLIILCSAIVVAAAPTVAARAQSTTAKPPIRGLISMGAYKFVAAGGQPVNTLAPIRAKPGIFGGIVVVASWEQLQPVPGGPLQSRVIDNMLNQVRLYNNNHQKNPLAIKLRVWGGFVAPHWAKSIGGAPIHVVQHMGQPNEKHRTLGRFWSPAYRQAWANLQQMLAAKYDSEPLIREVSITSCMSMTAEPFVVPTEAGVMPRLRNNGFTDAAFRSCVSNALDDYAPWQQSRLVLSVNPLHLEHKPGPGNPQFTINVMKACRQAIGARCVFDNHDLAVPLANPLKPIYAYMQTLGPEIEFQTANTTPANFPATIQFGVQNGASSIELYQDFGGFPNVPNATLRQWSNWIKTNTGGPN